MRRQYSSQLGLESILGPALKIFLTSLMHVHFGVSSMYRVAAGWLDRPNNFISYPALHAVQVCM